MDPSTKSSRLLKNDGSFGTYTKKLANVHVAGA